MPDSLALAQRALPIVTTLQTASAVSFSSFALLHLTSPFLSAFAPAPTGWNRTPAETAATAWQMLARVWYRDSAAMEATVVWGSLGIHLVSGAARRWLREFVRNEKRFALVPFLAHHIWVHRLLPFNLPTPLSSSLISYQLPSYLLSTSSARSPILPWLSYAALTVLGTYHAVVGFRAIWNPAGPKVLGPGRAKDGEGWVGVAGRWVWGVAGVVGGAGVLVGLGRMASEGRHVPEFIARRYADVVRRGFPL